MKSLLAYGAEPSAGPRSSARTLYALTTFGAKVWSVHGEELRPFRVRSVMRATAAAFEWSARVLQTP